MQDSSFQVLQNPGPGFKLFHRQTSGLTSQMNHSGSRPPSGWGVMYVNPINVLVEQRVTSRGYHGLSCKKSAGRWSRHHAANDVISRALGSVGVNSSRSLQDAPGATARDGLTLIPWAREILGLGFAQSYLPSTSVRVRRRRRQRKRRKRTTISF